jgi:predicted transcriptional regulator
MQVEWRRNHVLELTSKGHNQSEISNILQISESTISRDLSYLREQAKSNIAKYIDDKLPLEFEKCLIALNSVHKKAWSIVDKSEDERTQIQALSLAKECIANRIDLLTNATVVDDAIKFVEQLKTKSDKLVSAATNSTTTTNSTILVNGENNNYRGEKEEQDDIQRIEENNCR